MLHWEACELAQGVHVSLQVVLRLNYIRIEVPQPFRGKLGKSHLRASGVPFQPISVELTIVWYQLFHPYNELDPSGVRGLKGSQLRGKAV